REILCRSTRRQREIGGNFQSIRGRILDRAHFSDLRYIRVNLPDRYGQVLFDVGHQVRVTRFWSHDFDHELRIIGRSSHKTDALKSAYPLGPIPSSLHCRIGKMISGAVADKGGPDHSPATLLEEQFVQGFIASQFGAPRSIAE